MCVLVLVLDGFPHADRVLGHDVPIVEAVRKENGSVNVLDQRQLIAHGPEVAEIAVRTVHMLREQAISPRLVAVLAHSALCTKS